MRHQIKIDADPESFLWNLEIKKNQSCRLGS